MAKAELTQEPIDCAALQAQVESEAYGGVVLFAGNVRDNANGRRVVALAYEAYPPLALKELQRVVDEAEARWIGACSVIHRLGALQIGDCSVAVAFASPHRADAFEACRFVIDTLKKTGPIWKQEAYEDGTVWIEGEQSIPTQQNPD